MELVEVDFTDARLVGRYDRLFEACPEAFIQQSTYWAYVIKDIGPDTPLFLLASDGGDDVAGLPLYLYEHPLGNILTSVPQAGPLGGIFCRAGLSQAARDEAYGRLLERAVELARRQNCMSLTIITNPFADDWELYRRHLAPSYVLENFTQYLYLRSVLEGDSPASFRYASGSHLGRSTRRNIERGWEHGYRGAFCTSVAQLKAWYDVHCRRHGELGVVPLPWRLFENMFALLVPRNKAQLILIEHEGQIASGAFHVYHRAVVDAFMLSMASEHAAHEVNYVTVDYSLRWARGLGLRLYNWQSSQDKRCGVYRFKQQWGSRDSTYYFVTRLLCDPARIRDIGLAGLKRHYPWHYVVPFGVFTDGFDKTYFKKAGA